MGSATARFKEGIIVSGSAHHPDGTDSDYALVVTGSQFIDASDGGGLTIFKKEPDTTFLRFVNDDDPNSWHAYFAFDAAEHIYIFPGRSQDFYIQARENTAGSDPVRYPFRIYDNGKAKFEAGQDTGADSRADLPDDVVFFVSGSKDSDKNAVFGGELVVSGNMVVADVAMFNLSGSDTFGLDASNEIHVTAGGVLSYKVKTDGNVEFQTAVTSSHFKVEGAGGQFVAFNEDTVKLKHVNWYSSNDRQYGQGQLWYQQWFGAVEPSDSGAQGGRRIGFFFHKPNKGASDADGGTSAHPTNTHMYLDLQGMYLQTGSLEISSGDLIVTGSDGNSGAASFEDYIMAELSIAGLDIQNDTNAFTFNCPYDMVFEQMDIYMDTANSSNDLDVDMINVDDSSNVIFDINNIQNSGATPTSDTSPANATVSRGDRIRFRIANVSGSPQGCRANVRFRRLI